MIDWVVENIALISLGLSVIALLQPYFARFFKHTFGKLAFYPTGRVEIGFSEYGPTIGLQGTLRAITGDQFIQNISVRLVRKKDNATHNFSWLVFRELNYLQVQSSKFEIASAFLLRSNESKMLNILFADASTMKEYEGSFIEVRDKFQDFLRSKGVDTSKLELLDAAREEFRKSGGTLNFYTAMGNSFYWYEGEYEIEVSFSNSDTKKDFCFKYMFSLEKAQSYHIDLNRIALSELAVSGNYSPNFAYSPITECVVPKKVNRET